MESVGSIVIFALGLLSSLVTIIYMVYSCDRYEDRKFLKWQIPLLILFIAVMIIPFFWMGV